MLYGEYSRRIDFSTKAPDVALLARCMWIFASAVGCPDSRMSLSQLPKERNRSRDRSRSSRQATEVVPATWEIGCLNEIGCAWVDVSWLAVVSLPTESGVCTYFVDVVVMEGGKLCRGERLGMCINSIRTCASR